MSFDLRTHIRDPKTGRVVRTQPYRMFVDAKGTVIERNGVRYHPNGVELASVAPEAPVAAAPSAPSEPSVPEAMDEEIVTTGHVELE